MTRSLVPLALLALVTGACERPSERGDAERSRVGRIMLGALAYPRSHVVTYAAGDQAAEVVLTTPAPPGEVAAWYRTTFQLNGWDLRTETRERDGAITLYAELGERPLWVRLQASAGGAGTTYSVIGADVQGDTIR
jgi:hypothetical protein